MVAAGKEGLPHDDPKTQRSSTIFILKNTAEFTFAEFWHCLNPFHCLVGELLMLLHKNKFNDVLNKSIEACNEAQTQHQVNLRNHAQANEEKQRIAHHKNALQQQELKIQRDQQALHDAQVELNRQANARYNTVTSTSSGASTNNDLQAILKQLASSQLEVLSAVKTKVKGLKNSEKPPAFDAKAHGSLSSYVKREFRMWSRGQNLSIKESTLYFYMAFRNKVIHRNHVDTLAQNDKGEPVFDTVEELAKQVILELKYTEEEDKRQRQKFDAILHLFPKSDLDEEFNRIFNVRKLGWPLDSDVDNIKASKDQFLDALDLDKPMHRLLYSDRNTIEWSSADSFFSVCSILRKLQFRFKKTSVGLNNPSKPTNVDPNAMVCNNCILGKCSEHNSNTQKTNVNNADLGERTCRNTECGVKYKPANVKFVCCSTACNKVYKDKKYSNGARPSSSSKKSFRKKTNNVHKPVNSSQDSSEVSSISKRFHITPTHIFHKNCEVPSIVDNSLFDTGAGPTIITTAMVEKLNLQKEVQIDDSDDAPLGADQRPMKGHIGYIWLNLALEDSIGVVTKNYKIKALVHESLNHDMIIGQDSMKSCLFSFTGFPSLDMILFNATSRMYKKFNCQNRDKFRLLNNIRQREHTKVTVDARNRLNESENVTDFLSKTPETVIKSESFISIPVSGEKSTKPKTAEFNDQESFLLTVPGSILQNDQFKKLNPTVQNITCNFMQQFEEATDEESALSKII